ncbi:chorion peroxidase-like [Pollicipes pollicipes]|uniref:chorion peroxidase-like n=1 Tax=Pollicipes pollicipes TaxID=41117 RepID=UPI001885619A|nr:chorion peroxidase-like [Pollicipes pollicipes]
MQWGQFLDHDLALAPSVEPDRPCCRDGQFSQGAHPFCLPIVVSADDPTHSLCGWTCLEFTRSVPAWDARLRSLTQLNTRTSFVDGDMLYGVSRAWTASLRDDRGGRLRVNDGKFLLPDDEPEMCLSALESEPCFRSGDLRVNEQVRLAVMHTIWMREHNRIASRLEKMNPLWDDERLFQESRRIVVAEVQHITYAHWLPVVLGANFTRSYMIDQPQTVFGYSNRYNADTDPTIATEFSSAAFRFGHSMVNDNVFLFSNVRAGPSGFTHLKDLFFNPRLLYEGAMDLLAKSLVVQHPQTCDTSFAPALTEHLFQERGSACGLDLLAINIQRGRDHGIATYAAARRWCGLPPMPTFSDLTRVMQPDAVIRLAGVYRSVEDIDLFIGGVSERPAEGALVGPTFQCIIGNQFFRLRWGDNYFYDLGGDERPWRFTPAQLRELRRATLARVFCDAIGTITELQEDAFRAQADGVVTVTLGH